MEMLVNEMGRLLITPRANTTDNRTEVTPTETSPSRFDSKSWQAGLPSDGDNNLSTSALTFVAK